MTSDLQSSPESSFQKPFLERLGLSGQLMAGGAVVGIVSLFLPLVSITVEGAAAALGGVSMSRSVSSIDGWQGKLCLLAYIATLVLVTAVYPTLKSEQKNLAWGGLGAGALAALLALWLLIDVRNVGSATDMGAMGSVKSSIGLGAFLNLIAAGVVAYGGFLKAKEERLL